MGVKKSAVLFLFVLLVLSGIPGAVSAEENTDPGFFRDDNVAMGIDHSKPNSWLVYDLQKRLAEAKAQSMGLSTGQIAAEIAAITPPSGWKPPVPSKGNPKILVLLVDFPDYPHGASQGYNDVYYKTAKRGNNFDDYPYDNLHDYYYRSSYGQLNVSVTVKTWYRAAHERSYYTDNQWAIFKEVLDNWDDEINYAEYDNDGDGDIDDMWIVWTGPNEGWGSRWWAYHTGWIWTGTPLTWDGVCPREFNWLWYTRTWSTTGLFDPVTPIHEFGHSLGLPDYYDYDGDAGPDGGLGGFDMMDGNRADHNSFSKYLLGWTQPFVIGNTPTDAIVTLSPHGTSGASSVLVFPGATASSWGEFFLIENRAPDYGNDAIVGWTMRGLTIWHVDASLNDAGDGFRYDNSYTDHKLLRLMEADGKEEIEKNWGWDPGDIYTAGKIFWPTTSPNSSSYAGDVTNVKVRDITFEDNGKIIGRFMMGPYAPVVQSISPASGIRNTEERYTIPGYYFWNNPAPTSISIWYKKYIFGHWLPFQRNASFVHVMNENTIEFWLDLTGIPEGTYTVYVEYPGGGIGSLANALTVKPPYIVITAPEGGEDWPVTTTPTIQWEQRGLDNTDVRIDLYKDGPPGVHTLVINASVSAGDKWSGGSYRWTIPADVTPYRYYRLNVSSLPYPTVSNTTDSIEIQPIQLPNLTVKKYLSRDNATWVDDSIVLPAGSKVYWNITVKNTGTVVLDTVTVEDDNGFSATCSTGLARGRSWRMYYHGETGTKTLINTVTAQGTSSAGTAPAVSDTAMYYPVIPLPDQKYVPTDPDGDCIYEDLNANSRLDFADVVLYFTQMTWIAANEPVVAFDLNHNGRIDFADIVALFNEV